MVEGDLNLCIRWKHWEVLVGLQATGLLLSCLSRKSQGRLGSHEDWIAPFLFHVGSICDHHLELGHFWNSSHLHTTWVRTWYVSWLNHKNRSAMIYSFLQQSWSLMLIGPYISLYLTPWCVWHHVKIWVMHVTCGLIDVQWAINYNWP